MGTGEVPGCCAPQAVSASLPALKTGPSGANGDIGKEIIEREGILQCPSLGVYFPGCCHFSSGSTGPPWSSFIATSPSPPLVLSLSPHSCCRFITPLLSFLPSVLLLSTFSPHSSLSSHTFCGKHHLLPYFPLLYSSSFLPLQPQAILLFLLSSHCTLSAPLPSLLIISPHC